jgi:hypothetical protein
MERRVEAEWLDELAPDDPRALRSRRDLRWLNACMGNARFVARALREECRQQRPDPMVELGAGDGWFMWRVLRHVASPVESARVLLLDRQPVVHEEVRSACKNSGWQLHTVQADALAWLKQRHDQLWPVVIANLFLHHFPEAQLAELLGAIAARARALVAVEPRRSAWSLASSRMVGLIGCNRVTRHDAPISVRAGFAGDELSRLWPAGAKWRLDERPVGLFGHLFVARRN